MRRLAVLVASGAGCGFAPVAPGTVASAVALIPGALLARLGVAALPMAVLLASLLGLWAVRAAAAEDDPGWVVIDEFAGQWLTMLALPRPAAAWQLAAAFALFRLLDIGKPGPIGWANRQHSAAGVMGDDLLAGAIGAGLLAWALR